MLFNWRMLLATADAKYMDLMENCLYNSILPGISLDGESYFYTNPLRISDELPYKLRWPKERKKYISCFCCPPNTLRTLCQAQDYAYSVSPSEAVVYVNLYGSSTLTTTLDGIGPVTLSQKTDYPWDEEIVITFDRLKNKKKQTFTVMVRVPEWAYKPEVQVNSMKPFDNLKGGYYPITRAWQQGDTIRLHLPMTTRLVEANPLVEESRGQLAVMRGPILYCLESSDLDGIDIDNVTLPVTAQFRPVEVTICGSRMMALEAEAYVRNEADWSGMLYRPVATAKAKKTVRLVPYYAWGNRGKSEMTVWMPAAY
jgi:hypothetical protein